MLLSPCGVKTAIPQIVLSLYFNNQYKISLLWIGEQMIVEYLQLGCKYLFGLYS